MENQKNLNGEQLLFIDGQLTASESGDTYEVINPATEEVVGIVAAATVADADRALAAARRCFDETDWSTNTERRVRALTQFRDGLKAVADEWREQVIAEGGVPRPLTYGPFLDGPIDSITYSIQLLEKYQFERSLEDLGSLMGGATNRIVRKEATGVVAAITPWNAPVQININKIIPAMAAGCTVVLKGAYETPWAATMLGRIASQCPDMPAGAFNVLTSSPKMSVGSMLTSDPRVDVVSFTGSTATGRTVMESASKTIKKVFLELGGKSAMVVLDDADMKAAMTHAAFISYHAGQGCAHNTRLLVPRSRYEEALTTLEQIFSAIPYGDVNDMGQFMGPLISAKQRERVLNYIEIGKAEGARLVTGGRKAQNIKGYFVEPTLFADVDNNMRIAQEEIFGPVLVVIPFDNDDDAVRIANDSIYGLAGSVISASTERSLSVARRIRTGSLNVNGAYFLAPNAPFGGYKQSGIGREMGIEGFEEYLETKTIAIPVALSA